MEGEESECKKLLKQQGDPRDSFQLPCLPTKRNPQAQKIPHRLFVSFQKPKPRRVISNLALDKSCSFKGSEASQDGDLVVAQTTKPANEPRFDSDD